MKNRQIPTRGVGNKKKYSFLVFILIFILFIGLVGVSGFLYFHNIAFRPQSSQDEVVYVNIKEGESRQNIATLLEDLGLISNSNHMIWYMKITKHGGNIKAGNHILNKNMSIQQLVKALESAPDDQTIWVTLIEGLRYDEFAEKLDQAFSVSEIKKFDKQLFLDICENPSKYSETDIPALLFVRKYIPEGKSLEGFLFPDTYNFDQDANSYKVINTLVSTLEKKLKERNLLEEFENYNYTAYEVMTIASMLEREAYGKDEGKMIADIIIRRLEIGMYLGIDATSLYPLQDWKAILTNKELAEDNPYNTRNRVGLPPTPICSVGIDMIEATLRPEENEYLYYLHDSQNKIYYSETFSQHSEKASKYL